MRSGGRNESAGTVQCSRTFSRITRLEGKGETTMTKLTPGVPTAVSIGLVATKGTSAIPAVPVRKVLKRSKLPFEILPGGGRHAPSL